MCGVGEQTEPRESTCFAEIKNTIKSKTKKAIKTKNLYFNKWSNERRQLQYRLHIDDGLNPSMTISYINIIFYLQIKKNLSRRNREIWESKRRVLRGRSVCSERHCKVVSYIPGKKWSLVLRRTGTRFCVEYLLVHFAVNQAIPAGGIWGTFDHLDGPVTDTAQLRDRGSFLPTHTRKIFAG